MLYMDSPAGVGMSYSDTREDYTTNDTATTADLHVFLRRWLLEYPEHRETPFYAAGGSLGLGCRANRFDRKGRFRLGRQWPGSDQIMNNMPLRHGLSRGMD